MSKLYPLVLILQGYCLYHAYKNQKEYYWYLAILFLPILGSLLYLYINFGSRIDIDQVSETIKSTVDSNYEVDKLIKESKYSDTIANRIKLADTYASKGKYLPAITLYESCLHGYNSDDLKTKEKLMVAKYFVEDYDGVITLGNDLNEVPLFKNSESRIVYAWSLSFSGDNEKAEAVFKDMDANFSNYVHRSEYAKYLMQHNRALEAKDILQNLEDEISHMEPGEQRRKSPIRKEIKNLIRSIG